MTSRGVGVPPLTKRMTSGSLSRSNRLSTSASVNRRSNNRSVSRKTCIPNPSHDNVSWQAGERRVRNPQVVGSRPTSATTPPGVSARLLSSASQREQGILRRARHLGVGILAESAQLRLKLRVADIAQEGEDQGQVVALA